MSLNAYSPTRPGAITAQTVADAIALHRAAHGTMPVGIAVNEHDIDKAVAALQSLSLPLPIEENGGILRGEIWTVRER